MACCPPVLKVCLCTCMCVKQGRMMGREHRYQQEKSYKHKKKGSAVFRTSGSGLSLRSCVSSIP